MANNLTLVSSNPALAAGGQILASDGNLYQLTAANGGGVQIVVPQSVYTDDLVKLGFSYPAV